MNPYDDPDYWSLIRRIREIDLGGGDSTLARLVTADWLQEHGDEDRAEFIRVQCELAKSTQCHHVWTFDRQPDHCRYCFLVTENEWFTHNPEEGRTPPSWTPSGWLPGSGLLSPVQWKSGFIWQVTCPLIAWIEHGPDICSRHPVREVVITGVPQAGRFGDISRWLLLTVAMEHPDHVKSVSALSGFYDRICSSPNTPQLAFNLSALRWAEAEADK